MALAIPIPEKLLSFLSEKVAPILKTESQKLLSVPELIDDIKHEMEIAKDFLKKVEEEEDRAKEHIKLRIRELRELVFKAEDVIDEYELLHEQQRQQQQQGQRQQRKQQQQQQEQQQQQQQQQLQERQQLNNQPEEEFIGFITGIWEFINGVGFNNQHKEEDIGCIMGIWEFINGGSKEVVGFKEKHKIACKIVRIKKAMEKIKGSGKKYKESIFNVEEESDTELEFDDDNIEQAEKGKRLRDPGASPLYKDEKELVGCEKIKHEIIDKLDLDGEKYEGQYLLSMWGEPGVGKTTIARKVYEDENVRKHFSCCAWITATKPYKRVDLLKCLFKQFITTSSEKAPKENHFSEEDVEKLQDNEVIITDCLRKYLKQYHTENRYLVVLDDVSEMEELSKNIKAGLVPSHSKGGRIVVITKSERVANYWKTSSCYGETYNVQVLSKEDAKSLFNKKAFGNPKYCPNKLKDLRDKIVEDCDGLPSLIEKVGAHFSTTEKWIELYHDFQVNPLSTRSEKDLLSNYHDMPYKLKPCFLYLCMFPRGYKLKRMRIVRLWIAEGFVEVKGHRTCEEAAEGYLNELVERGMLRLLKTDETGRKRSFQIPNMWQRIMLPKLADLSFCQVLPHSIFDANNKCRRWCIHNDVQDTPIPPSVRSILSFVHTKNFPISWPSPFPESAFRLKVLDLSKAEFSIIPVAIGNLHNLRYLCLRSTKVKELPDSIGGLWNLQTLDLKQTHVRKLPKQMDCLHKLRHLLVCRYESTISVPVEIMEGVLENLTELQKLAFVDGSLEYIVRGLSQLRQIRRLAIVNLKNKYSEKLCEALKNMKELRSLSLRMETSNETLDLTYLGSIKSPLQFLERLYLDGHLKGNNLPNWVGGLRHLVRVRLRNSQFKTDPLGKLKAMPDLLVLELDNTYDGTKLDFGFSGFPKLRVLRIRQMQNLKTIEAKKAALPQLQLVEHQDCPTLLDIPSIPPQIDDVLQPPRNKNKSKQKENSPNLML